MLADHLDSYPIATKQSHRLFACVVVGVLALSAFSPTASGQEQSQPPRGYFKTIPLRGNTPEQAARESANGLTIRTWTYKVTSPRNQGVYTGQIMGTKWTSGGVLPDIPTYVIPLILNVPVYDNSSHTWGWVKFDPTAAIPTPCLSAGNVPLSLVENSPLFQYSQFTWNGVNLGTTQYIDALQRASFWTLGSSSIFYPFWHNNFGLQPALPITVNVPPQTGPVVQNVAGCQYAIVDHAWLDLYVTSNIIPSLQNLGVNPTTFPVILTYNVVQYDGALANCCILGYHSAYGSPAQVYAVSLFDASNAFGNASQDITALSHELAESMNDPFVSNLTPTWGNEGQIPTGSCDVPPILEVGDPLTGTIYPITNGYTYHPQELAMAGWFFDVFPPTLNWGIPGWFSSNGTFQGSACGCPPGGHHILSLGSCAR